MAAALNKYSGATPKLVFVLLTYLLGAVLYGIDTGSFGSLQALPSWLQRFGKYDNDPDVQAYVISSGVRAACNSIPFAGQLLGALISSNVIDLFGYKYTMVTLSIIQFLGIIVELTAVYTSSWGQFTAGRFIAYVAVGLAEMTVTHYNSEISPAKMRGLAAGAMILFNAMGNLWGAGMSRAYVDSTTDVGWQVPQGVQLLPPFLILCLIWFTPESPRWLVQQKRREEAVRALNAIRPQRDIDSGFTRAEVEAIELAVEESKGVDRHGRWVDLFKGNMLWRTWIAWSMFVFLQFTGVQFVNSFGATFYVEQGLANKSFTYIVAGGVLQIGSCLFQIIMYDFWGRRIFATLGGFFCFIFLAVVASLGVITDPTTTQRNAVIAGVILTQTFSRWSVTNAFVIGAEIGGVKMRRKIMATGGVVNMCCAILITSTVPYLMGPGDGTANLGAKVGWFFAAPSLILMLFGIFLVPELRGRSLEETDELYAAGLRWGWQFSKYQNRGTGAQIAALENEDHEKIRKLSATSIEGKTDATSDEKSVNRA